MRVKLTNIPQEFVDEYNLLEFQRNGWIYFEIIRGCYGFKRSEKLANDLLRTRLKRQAKKQLLLPASGSIRGDPSNLR